MSPMKSLLVLLLLCVLGQGAAAERQLAEALPPGSAELATDEAYHWGQLANGLRYVVREHGEPANQVSMRLLIYGGSLEETDPEQGLAHYLEHMAFKGSDNFPDNSFVQVMQRAGVSHGSHSNAHTGFDETVYKLDLPADDPELLLLGNRWFRDVLSALHLIEQEVESERGVILAEMRDRDNANFRAAQAHFRKRYPGMLLSQRWPIGIEETIRAADGEILRGYWQRWYRPDNAVLSIVGDLPRADLVALVHQVYGDMASPEGDLAAKPALGHLAASPAPVVSIHQEDEVAGTSIRIYAVADREQPAASLATWRSEALTNVATAILSRRLSELAESADAPILEGSCGAWWWHGLQHGALSVQVREQFVSGALELMVMELRRFLDYGPTGDEIEAISAEFLSRARRAVATAANRSSSQLSVAAYQAVKNNENVMTPEATLILWDELFATTDGEQLRNALQPWFSGEDLRWTIEVTTADSIAATTLSEVYARAQAAPIMAPEARTLGAWPYAIRGADESIAPIADEQDSTGIRRLRFANEVHASILPRSDKPQEVLLQLRIEREPDTAPAGLRQWAEATFLQRGTGELSRSQLRRHLAGTTVGLSVSVQDEALVFSGSSLPEDIPMWLSYAQGLLSDPGWPEERLLNLHSNWLQALRANQNDLEYQVQYHFNALLAGPSADRRLPSYEEAAAVSVDQLRDWLTPILSSGALELAVVGDVDPAAVTDAIGRTLAAMPQRQSPRVVSDFLAADALLPSTPLPQGEHRIAVDGAVARAQIVIAWQGSDMRDIARVRRMGQLSAALRVRLREELRSAMGEAYSPFAFHRGSDLWQDHGYLQAVVSVAPHLAEVARDAVLRAAEGLAEGGISEELFTEVQRPALTNLPLWRAENRYWLGQVVGRAWTQPQRIQWAADMESDFAAISAEELSLLAQETFAQEPLIVIGISEGRGDSED